MLYDIMQFSKIEHCVVLSNISVVQYFSSHYFAGLSAYPRLGMSCAGKESGSLALLAAVLTLCITAQHLPTTFRNTAVMH